MEGQRRGGLGRLARYRRGARRHDHGRVGMTRGDVGVDAFLIVSAVPHDRGYSSRDLVEQAIDLGTVVHLLSRERGGDDLTRFGIEADVQLAPRPARAGAVFLDQPLARPTQLQPRAVHQQVQGCGLAAGTGAGPRWLRHRERRRPAAERRMVRHAQRQPEQVHDGADQALGLPERQAEHGAQRERRQDRQGRIPGLPAAGRAWLSRPRCDCLVAEPHRQAPTLAQPGLVGRPVRDLVGLSRDAVAARLVQLEGQDGLPRSG